MKVLFVTNMYPVGSHQYYGIHVKEQIEAVVMQAGCNYDIYFINALENGKLAYIKSIKHIINKVKKEHYDIIHIHYGISGLFLLLYRPKAKIFLTLHGGDILKRQGHKLQVMLTKKVLDKVDRVFILNNEMASVIRKTYCEILPCGVDIDFFKPIPKKSCVNRTKLILFPGNPQRHVKNFPLFKKVIALLKDRTKHNIEYRYIHNLSRIEVRDLLNTADCLLMTSVSEGSPQIIKEALACGVPVVSVPVGDVRDVVENVPACFVSETYSPEELFDLVVLSFHHDTQLIRTSFVQKKEFDKITIANRIIENYNAV